MTTLTLSAAPRITKATSEMGEFVEMRKYDRCQPEHHDSREHLDADVSVHRHAARVKRTSRVLRQREPSAEIRVPKGRYEACRAQKSATSAVTPPSNTANRSSEMAPRIIGRLRMNETPEKIDRNEIGSRLGGVRSMRMTSMAPQATDKQSAETPSGTLAPAA